MIHEHNHKKPCAKCGCGMCCTKVENLCVKHGNYEILRDVNLHIHCGELTAVIGPNGAGKSTLLKALLGDVPYTGKFSFLDAKNEHTQRPVMGYVPQKLEFDESSPTSVLDLVAATQTAVPVWLSKSHGIRQKVKDILQKAQAEHLMYRRVGALSGGELQRVLLAIALDPVPDLLLMDEPVAGVDPGGLKLFYHTVSKIRKAYDLAIILVSHDLNLVAQFADRAVFLNHKTVQVIGTPQEVLSDPRVIETFGLEGVHLDM